MPKFSIILPTYRRNQSGFLRRAIRSVLDQTFRDFELFIVDDGSTDGSADTIAELAFLDTRLNHVRFDTNVGIPALTCAKALNMSKSPFVAWMFDDCEWHPDYLLEMNSVLDANQDVGIAFAQCEALFPSGSQFFGKPINAAEILAGHNHVPNVTTIIRRDVFDTLGWYDPRIVMIRNNDWDFIQRAVAAGVAIHHHPRVLAKEHGVALADSLGNSFDVDHDLVMAVARSNRTAELSPENIPRLDVLSLPKGINLDASMKLTYLRLLVGFAVHGWRPEVFDRISSCPVFADLGIAIGTTGEQVRWWGAEAWSRARKIINEKDVYINEKVVYIQDQLKYIERQDDLIRSIIAQHQIDMHPWVYSKSFVRRVLARLSRLLMPAAS